MLMLINEARLISDNRLVKKMDKRETRFLCYVFVNVSESWLNSVYPGEAVTYLDLMNCSLHVH